MLKRSIFILATSLIISLSADIITFAGQWQHDPLGWRYQKDDNSYPHSTWLKDDNSWYYFHSNSYMATGWIKDNDKWYYLHKDGAMATAWIKSEDKWYYLGADGAMLANTTTTDGYQLGADGAWIQTKSAENTENTVNNSFGINIKEHTLSSSSKHIQYLWRDANGKVPDYKVYVYTPENYNGHRVFIDAGHGDNSFAEVRERREKIYPVPDDSLAGMNTGMVGNKALGIGVEGREFLNVHNHIENEPQFALKIALNVKDKLLSQGYCVILSRNSDNQNLSNGARSVLAGETSDIMVSIHSNASVNKTAHGTLTFYPGDKDYISGGTHPGYTEIMGLTKNVQSSKKLADIMATGISAKTGLNNLGSHTAVLRLFSYSSIPTCLIEVGFSDNAIDAKILTDKKEEISQAIADGVVQYFAN